MSKLTIEIEADDVVDGEAHTPVITLSYNGQKLGLLQLVHFETAVADPIPTLKLLGIDRAGLVEGTRNLKDGVELEALKKAWPWAKVALRDPVSNEVRELP